MLLQKFTKRTLKTLIMNSNKEYLFYDDIVRGAGIGHTLCCYAFGLEMANRLNLEYLPSKIKAGHGLSEVEKFLGLEDFEEKRLALEQECPQKIYHIKYQMRDNQPAIPLIKWSKYVMQYIQNSYKNNSLKQNNLLKENTTNITVSIRRGDIVHYKNTFKDRLRPDEFYRDSIDKIIHLYDLDKYFINIFSDGAKGGNYYVNEKGERVEKEALLPKHHKNSEITCSDHTNSGKAGSRNIAFEHLQNCVNSDIFLGSISGYSELICALRFYRNCYMPVGDHNKKIDLIKCESPI